MQPHFVNATSTTVATADPGFLGGVSLRAPAGNAVSAIITETTGGRQIAILSAPANGADHFCPQKPIPYKGALTVTLTGAGAEAIVYQA